MEIKGNRRWITEVERPTKPGRRRDRLTVAGMGTAAAIRHQQAKEVKVAQITETRAQWRKHRKHREYRRYWGDKTGDSTGNHVTTGGNEQNQPSQSRTTSQTDQVASP